LPFPPAFAAGKFSSCTAPGMSSPNAKLSGEEITAEVGRFEKSLVQTRQQISEVQRKVVENMGAKEGDIFEAHLLMLEDRMLVDEVIRSIREQKVNAEHAFHAVSERYTAALAAWTTNISANAPTTCAT
jgi:phosphotransferase system enzyme I (PtsI)